MARLLVVAAVLALAAPAFGLGFRLAVGSKKCLQEDVHKDVLVVGEYAIQNAAGVNATLEVCVCQAARCATRVHAAHPCVPAARY